jgi:putative ABC transport system permease protein
MNRWLQGFAYRTNVDIWIFFASALAALLLAVLTICFQSIKAALTNPADSLRYE